jgi:hypothetical protein
MLNQLNRWNSTLKVGKGFKRKSFKGQTPDSVTKHHGMAAKRGLGIKLVAGKKTKEWDRVRAELKVEYEAMGITSCELGYDGCKRDDWLSFAHGRKRRKLQGDELKTLTILSCTVCHERIERMPADAMLAIVASVISERGIE